jgi:hypothetical protein
LHSSKGWKHKILLIYHCIQNFTWHTRYIWNWFSDEHVQLMVIHILVYQNVLKFVNFSKTQSPIGVFVCYTRFGWNKRTKHIYNFYLEIFNEILYIILLECNKVSSITFDKICGHFLLWFDAHISNLWEYILVKKIGFANSLWRFILN